MAIPFGGDRVTVVSEALASAFAPGDRLVVVQSTGDILHIPSSDWESRHGRLVGLIGRFLRWGRSPTSK